MATRSPGSRGLACGWAERLAAEASRRPRTRALSLAQCGDHESPGRPPPLAPGRPGPGVPRRLIDGRVGGRLLGRLADRRFPNSLCPHPRRPGSRGASPPPSPRPLPVFPPEGAGVRPPLLPDKRSGARAPGGWEAAALSRLFPFPRNLTGTLFAPRGPLQSGLLHPEFIAKMESEEPVVCTFGV